MCTSRWTSSFFLLAGLAFGVSTSVDAQAVRSGFDSSVFTATSCGAGCTPGSSAVDDGSMGPLGLGFTVDFFGTDYSSVWLNVNGNLTLTGALLTYTPFAITGGSTPMFAPFFADVDTRVGSPVRFGAGAVGSRGAWGATWSDVCFYSTDCSLTNTFQVVLIDRSDIAAGDFDIEFNYDRIQWETGDASGGTGGLGGTSAHAGWTNGVGDFYELTGSGVSGAFLDSNGSAGLIYNSLNSNVDGRYVFNVRSGRVVSVPEPESALLLLTGLFGIAGVARGRRRRPEA